MQALRLGRRRRLAVRHHSGDWRCRVSAAEHVATTPWPRPPLTANQRLHWAKRADLTRMVRRWAALTFRGVKLTHPIIVELDWHVPDKRRRDADNTVPTLKA